MKTNYYLQSLQEIEQIKQLHKKPKLLLHACCGPCAVWPLEFLSPYFKITILYNNSNIYPSEEYHRRLHELTAYLEVFNQTHSEPIDIQIPPYDNIAYTAKLAPLKEEPERGKRCHLCYRIRIEEAFKTAVNQHFDWVCTVMSISRQKDSQIINQIAKELDEKYPDISYFYSDFKKDNGILKANALIEKNGMYRQDYCGCVYSYTQRKCTKEEES